jgi:hypothetical protein
MENKKFIVIIITGAVLFFWVLYLTFETRSLSANFKTFSDDFQNLTAVVRSAPSARQQNILSIGNYTAKDFASFEGNLIAKNKEDQVITVMGYLKLKQEIMAKLGNQAPPQLPVEIKYIVIDKNTKIVGASGESLIISDLTSDDDLKIIASDSSSYLDPAFLASEIFVTKKFGEIAD